LRKLGDRKKAFGGLENSLNLILINGLRKISRISEKKSPDGLLIALYWAGFT
jgi:hypothetical protein